MKKGGNFKTGNFFCYPESFLYCLYSKHSEERENTGNGNFRAQNLNLSRDLSKKKKIEKKKGLLLEQSLSKEEHFQIDGRFSIKENWKFMEGYQNFINF